jgi:hypothetical protein
VDVIAAAAQTGQDPAAAGAAFARSLADAIATARNGVPA